MGAILSCCNETSATMATTATTAAAEPSPKKQKKEKEDLKSMNVSQAVQRAWDLDSNRLRPNVDYVINVQKGKKPWWKEDKAPDPLFTKVNDKIWGRPTYNSFMKLLDNYSAQVGESETLTAEARKEIDTFLKACMETPCMRFCHDYCHAVEPENVPPDRESFQKLIFRIWFELYRREKGGPLDSSGFEHVFVGEIRDGKITGFHNWIQFFKEEKAGRLDYRGYIKPKSKTDAQADSDDHILTVQFLWQGVEKEIGTMFIGVAPEFEMAVYTICFLCGTDKNAVTLKTGTDVFGLEIVCHKMHKGRIGSAFPYVTSHHEE